MEKLENGDFNWKEREGIIQNEREGEGINYTKDAGKRHYESLFYIYLKLHIIHISIWAHVHILYTYMILYVWKYIWNIYIYIYEACHL